MSNNNSFEDFLSELKAENDGLNQSIEVADRLARIIAFLSNVRIRNGVTQRQLAEKCGVKQSTIARIETLQNIPRIDTLIKMALNLNVNIELYESTALKTPTIVYLNQSDGANDYSWSYYSPLNAEQLASCS